MGVLRMSSTIFLVNLSHIAMSSYVSSVEMLKFVSFLIFRNTCACMDTTHVLIHDVVV